VRKVVGVNVVKTDKGVYEVLYKKLKKREELTNRYS
jgi:hypothetical protein